MPKKTTTKTKPAVTKTRKTRGKNAAKVSDPIKSDIKVDAAPDVEVSEDSQDSTKSAVGVATEAKPEPQAAPPVAETKNSTMAGETWWNTTGEQLVRRGHGQRNIVLKAGREAGLLPADAIRRFAAFDGNFRSRILSLFSEV